MDTYCGLLRTERQRFSVFSSIYVALRRTPADHPAYPQLKAACRTAEQCWREARAILDADRRRQGLAPAPEPVQWLVEPDDVVVSSGVGGVLRPRPSLAPPDGQMAPARMGPAPK